MKSFAVFIATLTSLLIPTYVTAAAEGRVRVSKQTVSIRSWETGSYLSGVFKDGEHAGVHFHLVPDVSVPLPKELRPETLLVKLNPAVKVVSVGLPLRDLKTREEIISSLPQTAFRLEGLFSADGRVAIQLGEPFVPVYVVGYSSTPCPTPPDLEQLTNERFRNDARVCISGYELEFGDVPSCDRYAGLCTSQSRR